MDATRRNARRGNLLDCEPQQHQSHRASVTTPKGPSHDVRKRMDDIYGEMEQNWKSGRLRLPLKFMSFRDSEIMFIYVRAAIGYALAFVKVKTLQRDHADRSLEDPKLLYDESWHERIAQAIETQSKCATAMASAYARLVLHCSNYENHKEDEHFFECVYYFVCSVVKLSIPPDFWKTVENELGFLFRGAQFSSNVKTHTTASAPTAVPTTGSGSHKDASGSTGSPSTTLTSSGALVATSGTTSASDKDASSSAAKKIQSLSANGGKESERSDAARFVLPTTNRVRYFTESVPVKRIVSELDATKSRATRNIEVSQAIRERIANQKSEERRRQLEAVVTPRQSVRLEITDPMSHTRSGIPAIASAKSPSGAAHRVRGLVSPRISMKTTYTTRSPALNHLLPATEERVRLVLQDYEHELQTLRLASKTTTNSMRSPDNHISRSGSSSSPVKCSRQHDHAVDAYQREPHDHFVSTHEQRMR